MSRGCDIGTQLFAKKPTQGMTNSCYVAERVRRRCDGFHACVGLMRGRAAVAATYPDKLCSAICQGLVAGRGAG